jgi:hypothetical protein
VCGRHRLEEDTGLGGVDVGIHLVGPCGEAALERHHPIHALEDTLGLAHVVPPLQRAGVHPPVARVEGEHIGATPQIGVPGDVVHRQHLLPWTTSMSTRYDTR